MGPNPFKPTAGKMPPILIGRQAVIDDFTDGLRNGAGAPGRLMLVTGQRGFGKTVVLTELGNVARDAGWVEVAETASPGFVERLAERLEASAHKGARITASPQLTVPMVGSLSLGSVEMGNAAAPSTLRDAINQRLKRMDKGLGVLITLDEAQGADIDELVALGTAVQHVIRDQDATDLSDADKRGVALVISALPSMVDDLLDQKVLTFLRRAMREDLAEVPVPDVRNAYLKTVRENGMDISLENAQMAAEVLDCEPDDITVFGADTDASPYDSGSYASSTTYITGMATQNAALELRENIKKIGAQLLGCTASEVDFDGKEVYIINPDGADNGAVSVSLSDIATKAQVNNTIPVDVTATYSSPVSPPPYMVGMVEIELDKETGAVKILDYQAVVDCGIPVNPNLARVQTEGGIGQGIGMALYENVTYNAGGKIAENDLMQYKIPTRQDVGHINVEFETSYEPSGPFGVKSIGEIVINTPAPALAHAIYRATGVWHRTVPFTPEKILMGMVDPNWHEKDLRVK